MNHNCHIAGLCLVSEPFLIETLNCGTHHQFTTFTSTVQSWLKEKKYMPIFNW